MSDTWVVAPEEKGDPVPRVRGKCHSGDEKFRQENNTKLTRDLRNRNGEKPNKTLNSVQGVTVNCHFIGAKALRIRNQKAI